MFSVNCRHALVVTMIIERPLVSKVSSSTSQNCVFILTYLGLHMLGIEIQTGKREREKKVGQIK